MRVMAIGDRRFDADVLRRSLATLGGAQLDELVADVYEGTGGYQPRAPGEPDKLFRRRAQVALFDSKGDPRGVGAHFAMPEDVRARLGDRAVEALGINVPSAGPAVRPAAPEAPEAA